MTIEDIECNILNEQLAYIIGMCYPLYKEKNINNKKYLAGTCNYKKISGNQLVQHIMSVKNFLEQSEITKDIILHDNKGYSNKQGFTMLIEYDIDYKDILNKKVEEIVISSSELKKMFIRGCFDGRASWDTSRKYLSIDVDRDTYKKNLIFNIAKSIQIGLNINNRKESYGKNDQIRILNKSIDNFLNNVGLFSKYREDIIKNNIKLRDIK